MFKQDPGKGILSNLFAADDLADDSNFESKDNQESVISGRGSVFSLLLINSINLQNIDGHPELQDDNEDNEEGSGSAGNTRVPRAITAVLQVPKVVEAVLDGNVTSSSAKTQPSGHENTHTSSAAKGVIIWSRSDLEMRSIYLTNQITM